MVRWCNDLLRVEETSSAFRKEMFVWFIPSATLRTIAPVTTYWEEIAILFNQY